MSIEEVIIETVNKAVKEALSGQNSNVQRDDLPEILNVKQAAQFLNVGTGWIYDNMSQLPHFDAGGTKFLKSELLKYCISKTSKSFQVVKRVK